MSVRLLAPCWAALAVLLLASSPARCEDAAPAAEFSAEQSEFFTREVLPILSGQCFRCHGAETHVEGELHLTTRDGILTGGASGSPAVDLETPNDSPLLQAVRYEDLEMPPKGKLAPADIAVLEKWVSMGLPWDDDAAAAAVPQHIVPQVNDEARKFWSFQAVERPAVPAVKQTEWVRNPIDAFVLARLEAQGFQPAPEASRPALLRRLYYAVTGLPPSPEEIEAFVADASPDAYEKRVDQLLASRHYGEHWARHWLDVVRFAETNSFERDGVKAHAWKYRDYVIRAFNQDKPYDQFIREQLAGDELQPITRDGVIATGFYRLGLWDDEPADRELAYYDQLDDIVSTAGQAFLGLTTGCARCHDHKIDPFPQEDYYRLLAFFHGVNSYGNGADGQRLLETVQVADPATGALASVMRIKPFGQVAAPADAELAEYERKLAELNTQIDELEQRAAEQLKAGERDDFAHPQNRMPILQKRVGTIISPPDLERYCSLCSQREQHYQQRPASIEPVMAVIERGAVPRDTYILARGNPEGRGDEKLTPGFPSVLCKADQTLPEIPAVPSDALSSGRRLVLANWIACRNNPLTARVMVNRLWQYNFGRGLVRSSSNFGYAGTLPTHPELLDWLASELADGGMRLKALQRLMLTSSTFRMASQADPAVAQKDPENDLLSHFDLRRLNAEEVRDSILAVCGNLNLAKTEGPGVYPIIPAEVLAGQSRPGDGWGQSTPEERAARSVFVHVKRSLSVPLLASFDAPDPDGPCPVRFTTTQPAQALGMLNSQFLAEQSLLFAKGLRAAVANDVAGQVRLALRRVMQRTPTQAEIDRGVKFIAGMQQNEQLSDEQALARFCLLALSLNEFVFLD